MGEKDRWKLSLIKRRYWFSTPLTSLSWGDVGVTYTIGPQTGKEGRKHSNITNSLTPSITPWMKTRCASLSFCLNSLRVSSLVKENPAIDSYDHKKLLYMERGSETNQFLELQQYNSITQKKKRDTSKTTSKLGNLNSTSSWLFLSNLNNCPLKCSKCIDQYILTSDRVAGSVNILHSRRFPPCGREWDCLHCLAQEPN